MKQNGSAVRCAIYARVSTADQNLDNQPTQLREFAARSGWEITGVYRDEASAKNGDRAGFESMMADASRRRFDVLLFWRLTRRGSERRFITCSDWTTPGLRFVHSPSSI